MTNQKNEWHELPKEEYEKLQKSGQAIATVIDEALQELHGEKMGFGLLIFDFGADGRVFWISNADRKDMVEAMKEITRAYEASLKAFAGR